MIRAIPFNPNPKNVSLSEGDVSDFDVMPSISLFFLHLIWKYASSFDFFINPEIVTQFYIFLFRKITICAVRRIQYSTEILSNSRSLECNAQLYVTLSLDTSPQLCWPVKFNSASFLSQPWCKLVPLFLMI